MTNKNSVPFPHNRNPLDLSHISANLCTRSLSIDNNPPIRRIEPVQEKSQNAIISFARYLIFHFTCQFSFSIFHFPFERRFIEILIFSPAHHHQSGRWGSAILAANAFYYANKQQF